MQLSEWLILALSCFIGASSPGPSIALMIRAVLKNGKIAGLVFAITHGFGILLYAGLVSTGLATILLIEPALMLALQILGIGFLLYVCQTMIRGGIATRHQPQNFDTEGQSARLIYHARDGFLIVFLNPKVAAFFLAIFSQFLDSDQTALTRIGMTTIAWVIDTGWYVLMAFVLSIPSILTRLRNHHGMIEASMGFLLLCAAFLMIARIVISL